VRFLTGSAVHDVRRQGNLWRVSSADGVVEAPILVNCAGAWAGALAAQLGEPVPLRAEAPMLMITERVAPFCAPVVGATGRPLSFKQFENGTVLIGGGHRGRAEPARQRTHLDFAGLAASAATARAIFPCMEGVRVVRCWAGIEAVMPDEIPVIGPSGTHPGAYHAFGFSAHGYQLGPITGKIVADLVVSGATPLPIAPFSIERFRGDSPQECLSHPVT
jgi:sarcosine oxidase subunit beta